MSSKGDVFSRSLPSILLVVTYVEAFYFAIVLYLYF